MEEKYLVIGIGVNKKGNLYSRLCKIVEYTDKETKEACSFVDFKQTKFSNDIFNVGDIKTVASEIY